MKKLFTLILLSSFISIAQAQENKRQDIVYTMSGFGFTMPLGETADYLSAKFSNTLGANIGLGKTGGLFIYPKLNLHSYKFDQQVAELGNPYLVKGGRATTYLLNVNFGHRFTNGNFSYYGYVGAGGGFILTHRGTVNSISNQVDLRNESTSTATMELGAGIEYKMGNVLLFGETSYLRAFEELENRTFHAMPITVGIKTNLSKIFAK